MTKLTALDLNPFLRHAIGVDRLFDRLVSQIDTNASANNYPPHDVIKTGENTFEVRLAVAGFLPGEVEVSVQETTLIVTGEKFANELPEGHEYLFHGISARKFIKTFQLADGVEVTNALSKNGILTVNLERLVPETLQPKTIAITYES